MPLHLMEAVDRVNEAQKQVLVRKIRQHYGAACAEKTLAIWGLAFKPRTDDIREAPALLLVDALLAEGVQLRVHDPEAMANVRALYGDQLTYCDRPYGALEGADGLVDRHGVAGVSQPGLRGDAPAAARAGHLRRPQPLRSEARHRLWLHVLVDRRGQKPAERRAPDRRISGRAAVMPGVRR